jgi:hypothetical protein
MNVVRLSGYLLTPVRLRVLKNGLDAAMADLRFNRTSASITLVAIDARKRQLEQFQQGDWIRVDGELAIHPDSKILGVLVDECRLWTPPVIGAERSQ